MEKLDGKTRDIVGDNVEKLRELFPSVFTEKKINFDMLQKILGEHVETEKERYSFNWNGKSEAIKIALKQSTGTLRPAKDESKNWDTTENIYIEGDNLEVLRILQDSYRNKIKMIYIDPPYNTGKDFVYSDKFSDTVEEYKEKAGEKLKANPDTSGKYHTNWLNMMYPRLRLARNLLTDDGVIFISIDDNEVHNLRKIADEIFGEENFVGKFKWNRVAKAPALSETIRIKYEYVICYKKGDISKFFGKKSYNTQAPVWHNPNKQQELLFPAKSIRVPKSFKKGSKSEKYQVELLDEILEEEGLNKFPVRILACSAWGQEKINSYIKDGSIFQIKKDIGTLYSYLPQGENNFIAPSDLISKEECGVDNNTNASAELEKMGIPFTNPKPVSLVKYLINMVTYVDQTATFLDFFSGSATAAHAVMQLNAEDGGSRKCISVQLPEETDEKSEAHKAGYKTISGIGMERIRRAGEKILKENKEILAERETPLDVGFKVFKLDTTNLKQWDDTTTDIEGELLKNIEGVKDDRDSEDMLYEVLLKYGVDISVPIEEIEIESKKAFSVAGGFLLVCFDKELTMEVIEEIAKKKPNRVVFYDTGFADDAMKINAEQTLKKYGVEDIRVI